MNRILITGGCGQIGSELSKELVERYGKENILVTDIKQPKKHFSYNFEILDVMDQKALDHIIRSFKPDAIFHMAAILSATGESNPLLCWNINMQGSINTFESALKHSVRKVFLPSSIAVWGNRIDKDSTIQDSVLYPTTMYGVTKVSGEVLGFYYYKKYGLDIRGIRYPGIISSETLPGGGTTDYAVDIFYKAILNKEYDCFLSPNTVLPMMYMPDCIKATIKLMEADPERLIHRTNFNVTAMSFSPEILAAEIRKHITEFKITYSPDFRQKIAESWPRSIDDSQARDQWDWKPDHNISSMTKDMIEKLRLRII